MLFWYNPSQIVGEIIWLHGLLKFIRLLINAIINSSITATSMVKIKAKTINILADGSPFPCIGGLLCESEDTTDVGDDVIVGVDLGILGVEVSTFILGVGVA